jgi:phytoene dehydrogenase-like protein
VTWDEPAIAAYRDRIEQTIEARAPGFVARIADRHVLAPADLERLNANLVGGAINGGSAELHQQLVFRPLPGLARARTPIRGLYLGSASAHPGGGVHGGAGAGAARAALRDHRLRLLHAGRAWSSARGRGVQVGG